MQAGVTLTPAAPAQRVTLRMPLAAWLADASDAMQYEYRVAGLHDAGPEPDRVGAVGDWGPRRRQRRTRRRPTRGVMLVHRLLPGAAAHGASAFPDHLEDGVAHVLPDALALAQDPSGAPDLLVLRYAGEDDEPDGGLVRLRLEPSQPAAAVAALRADGFDPRPVAMEAARARLRLRLPGEPEALNPPWQDVAVPGGDVLMPAACCRRARRSSSSTSRRRAAPSPRSTWTSATAGCCRRCRGSSSPARRSTSSSRCSCRAGRGSGARAGRGRGPRRGDVDAARAYRGGAGARSGALRTGRDRPRPRGPLRSHRRR